MDRVVPQKLHDGDTIRVGERCWAEFIQSPAVEGSPERVALRLANGPGPLAGTGIVIEGVKEFGMLVNVILAAVAE